MVRPTYRSALIVALMALAFGLMAQKGATQSLDTWFIVHLRAWALSLPDDVKQFMLAMTWVGDFARRITITLTAATWLAAKGHRRAALVLLLGVVIFSALLEYGVKPIFDRPRPDIVSWLDHPNGSSLPSGHSFGAAMTYPAIAILLARSINANHRRWAIWATVLAILIGFSRIWAGVHWPSDVVMGLALGAAACMVLIHIAQAPVSVRIYGEGYP